MNFRKGVYGIMRKIKIIVLLVLFSYCSLPIVSINAELDVNDFFIYEIESSKFYAKIDQNETIIKNYKFGSHEFPVGTEINATVTDINIGVEFTFLIENYSRIGYLSSNWFAVLGEIYTYFTTYQTMTLVEDWDDLWKVETVLFQLKPYIDPSPLNLDFLSSLGDTITNSMYVWKFHNPNLEYEFDYIDSEGVIYFESWFGGNINNDFGTIIGFTSSYQSTFDFGNNFQLSLNKQTGVVQGFGFQGWVDGVINNKQVKVSLEMQYELAGYNLPKYAYGLYRNFASGFGLLITLFTLILLIPIWQMRKK